MNIEYVTTQFQNLTAEASKVPQDTVALVRTIAVLETHVLNKGHLSFADWLLNRPEFSNLADKIKTDNTETKSAELAKLRLTLTEKKEVELFDDAQFEYINYLLA